MTVGEILADLYRDLGFTTTPAAPVVTRLRSHINKAHATILREPSLTRLRDSIQPLTFASVANQAVYGFPSQISRPYYVTERDTDRRLEWISLSDLRDADPGLTATGTPWAVIDLGYGPIQTPPASTGLWVASGSASDTTQTARVLAVRSGGLPTGPLTATLNGTTRVAIGTITDIVDVQNISISATALGVVSFYDAATLGNLLAEIGIGLTYPKYLRLQLYPIPTAVTTYYVDGQFNIPVLSSDQDVPLIPEEFQDLLSAYARMREYEITGDGERMQSASSEFTIGLTRLKHMVATTPSEVPVMGRPTRRRFSRFGPWCPADDGYGW